MRISAGTALPISGCGALAPRLVREKGRKIIPAMQKRSTCHIPMCPVARIPPARKQLQHFLCSAQRGHFHVERRAQITAVGVADHLGIVDKQRDAAQVPMQPGFVLRSHPGCTAPALRACGSRR